MAASFSPLEKSYFDQLFAIVDKDSTGVLPGQETLPFLVSSNLPQQTLGEIWAIADPENNGFLTREGWYKAARLIGWLQKGAQSKVDESLISKTGPLPTFNGYPNPPEQPAAPSPMPPPKPVDHGLPPLSPADRAKFTRIFVGCGPSNGLVSGDKARDVFLKSQLSYDKLAQIWNLADTQQRGSLDLTDFVIGMYLIQSCMANPALILPPTLPTGLYEVASGGRSLPTSSIASPVMRQNTGPASPIQRQFTGGTLQPQRTGQSFTAPLPPNTPPRPTATSLSTVPPIPPPNFGIRGTGPASTVPWDVTPDAKATSDRFFAQLDTQNKGVIEGDVAVPFMLQSQLDEATLASVWDLSDIRQEGKLDRDEFAVAMHLINSKLAGQELPTKLPESLVPPALRSYQPQGGQPASQPSAARDLFDLMDDAPQPASDISTPPRQMTFSPPSQITHATFAPQPPPQAAAVPPPARQQPSSDLLGDDAAEVRPAPVSETSAEVGNKMNHLSNVERSITDLEKTRGELEQSEKTGQQQLEELEAKLSAARVKHEAESKAVADLRTRVSELATKLKSLEAETISAESDLTAMRLEKDELEQALLKDKEEVRSLQKRIKEVEDEKTGMRLLLEKIKKEARQQKGMVTIAKKQLSTSEMARDTLQQDIRAAEKEMEASEEPAGVQSPSTMTIAAAVPLPATPHAMSPQPTGMSQRSNNPFDRLKSSAPTTTPHEGSTPTGTAALMGVGAAFGAAAGVVAAGATSLYSAAKEVVAPEPTEEDKGHNLDPFGVPTSAEKEGVHSTEHDPFQPFDAPITAGVAADAGFDDSFGKELSPTETKDVQPPAFNQGMSDFDSAFADLHETTPEELGSNITAAETENEHRAIPTGIPKSALPVDLRPDAERTFSTQAVASDSGPNTPALQKSEVPAEVETTAATAPSEELKTNNPVSLEPDSSDDEEDGPEDVEGPRRTYSSIHEHKEPEAPTTLTAPVASPTSSAFESETVTKVRRSAPPPPSAKSTAPESSVTSPFDAPAVPAQKSITAIPPGATAAIPVLAPPAAPASAKFDEDDDFDFTDLPAADVETSTQKASGAGSAFDDEFAGFDDDFDKPSSQHLTGSDQSGSHTFEMVPPQTVQSGSSQPAPVASGAYDEWGMSSSQKKTEAAPTSSNVLSFDDAFGGEFEPAQIEDEHLHEAPSGPPPAQLSAPPLPDRRLSEQPQDDDLEDVKKLCAMGFPRSLVVEALDANGYDFQKALNILLVK